MLASDESQIFWIEKELKQNFFSFYKQLVENIIKKYLRLS